MKISLLTRKAISFYKYGVLPELVGKWYSLAASIPNSHESMDKDDVIGSEGASGSDSRERLL